VTGTSQNEILTYRDAAVGMNQGATVPFWLAALGPRPQAAPVEGTSNRTLALVVGSVSLVAIGALAWILYLHEPTGDGGALAFMPAVNAAFNTLSAAFVVAGLAAIRSKRPKLHRALMISALSSSALFLVGYITYHFVHGDTRYPIDAPFRGLYLSMLASHVVLSIVALPIVLATAWLGLTSSHPRHRKLARFTVPVWLYVSVTGVLVFAMLRSAAG
jgi:putative membrane protein